MKKLVYILVAVFTMISVNANADKYMYLHWSYPGCDVEHIDTIWVDDDSNIYKDKTKTEEIEYRVPTCKGYKFTNFYYKDEDGNLITYSGNPIYIYKNGTIRPERLQAWGSNDVHLYGNGWTRVDSEFKDENGNECFLSWAKPNYKGKEGFWIYTYDSLDNLISRTWYDWNYMKDIDAFNAQLYLHYNYPGAIEAGDAETVHQTIWIDNNMYSDNILYTDKTKTKEFVYQAPTCKGYYFVGWGITKDAGEHDIYIYNDDIERIGIRIWVKALNQPIHPHLYAIWVKNTENYKWNWDYSGFYEKDEKGRAIKNNFIPWNHMYTNNTTTSINEVESTSHSTKEGIYTLNGVKVENITKSGIYIINGKKVMVK